MYPGKNDLKIRFSKIQHEVLIKKRKARSSKLLEMDSHPFYTPKIQSFTNIAGIYNYSHIFFQFKVFASCSLYNSLLCIMYKIHCTMYIVKNSRLHALSSCPEFFSVGVQVVRFPRGPTPDLIVFLN